MAGMSLVVLTQARPQDRFCKLVLSTTNFFRARVKTRFEGARSRVLTHLMDARILIGVSCDAEMRDDQWAILLDISRDLDALILLECGLVDPTGVLVLGVDGRSDLVM